jgi:DNA-binding response OmpR family regulator
MPQEPPCLVIVNAPKPRHAVTLIRSLQTAYAAPVLATSARFRRGLGASADAAQRLGARKLLPKPFTRAELLAAVRARRGLESGADEVLKKPLSARELATSLARVLDA